MLIVSTTLDKFHNFLYLCFFLCRNKMKNTSIVTNRH